MPEEMAVKGMLPLQESKEGDGKHAGTDLDFSTRVGMTETKLGSL